MAIRGLYKRNYEKVLDHIKTNTEWEEEVLIECRKLLSEAMRTKDMTNRMLYFNHLDFRLRETYGIQVYIEE